MKLVEKESRPRIMQLQPFWTKSTSFQILGQWLIMLILTKTVGWSTQVRSQVASGQLLLPQSLLLLSSSAGNSLPTSFQAWWLLLHGWKPLKQAEEVEKIWRKYIYIHTYIYIHISYIHTYVYIYICFLHLFAAKLLPRKLFHLHWQESWSRVLAPPGQTWSCMHSYLLASVGISWKIKSCGLLEDWNLPSGWRCSSQLGQPPKHVRLFHTISTLL